ncbi:mutator type transposase [Tanacetum coccineum]
MLPPRSSVVIEELPSSSMIPTKGLKFTKTSANNVNVNDMEHVPFLANVNVQDPEPLPANANTTQNETVESIVQELLSMDYEFNPFEDNMTAGMNDQQSVNEQEKYRDDNYEPVETLVEGETLAEDDDSNTKEGDNAEVEWVRHSNCGQQQDHEPIPGELDVIDNDYFDSGTDSEDDGIEKIRRNKLKEIKKANESADNIVRKLFLAKNDKLRIRAKCLGKIHVFTLDGEGPSNTKEVAPKKKTTKVKGKKDVGPSDPVRPNKKGKYELGVSRMKAFKAKSAALNQVKGDYSQQYTMLRDYCLELRRANLDTTIKIEVERDSDTDLQTRVFKRIYICLGPLKKGFKACGRDLLGLDGAFMKGPYPGQLLTTVGLDGNNGIYPLAYAIVEKETTCSWIWFLECLGDDLEMTRESNFTFISITIAMTNVSPCTEHKYCLRPIHENMKKQWNGQAYKELLWRCVAATTIPYFDKAIEELKQFNKQAFEWLAKIHAHSWSRSYFSAKSDILLNNLCEYFNGKILNARDSPIITTLEYIREYLMRRMVNVIAVINKIDGPLTPSINKLLKVTMDKANKYKVGFNKGKSMRLCKGQKDPMNETCTSTSQRSTNVAALTRKRPSDAGNAPANKKQSTTSSNAAQKQKKNGKRSI